MAAREVGGCKVVECKAMTVGGGWTLKHIVGVYF